MTKGVKGPCATVTPPSNSRDDAGREYNHFIAWLETEIFFSLSKSFAWKRTSPWDFLAGIRRIVERSAAFAGAAEQNVASVECVETGHCFFDSF